MPVAAFLAVASSAAGFAGLLQLMFVAFIRQHAFWVPLFAAHLDRDDVLVDLVALKQTQVVRLLAYSGIAQAGYSCCPSPWSRATGPSTARRSRRAAARS